MKKFIILILLLDCNTLFGQNISGVVLNEKSKLPIEYVNIGVLRKNIGTVSDCNGKYNLIIDSQFDNDTLLFSNIGYLPYSIKIADLKRGHNKNIFLKEKAYDINEVIVRPKKFKQRTLGVSTHFKKISVGFKDNLLGYELGILMKVKKTALIKRVNINISACSYDSIFYRLNIYKVLGKMNFENILSNPIYIRLAKNDVKDEIHIDLQSQNIVVDGNFLVTLEQVKNLGKGYLYFCAGLMHKTYYRKTSQGEWQTAPIGIGLSVDADIEK
jgi:hypothetical protein